MGKKYRVQVSLDEREYLIIKEYAEIRGYSRVSDVARRAIYRLVNQNPVPGKPLGTDREKPEDPIIYYSDMKEPGWVYFMTCVIDGVKYCKIGKAKDIKARAQSIGVLLPVDITVFAKYRVGNKTLAEQALHSHFKARRHKGEWFVLTEEDYAQIEREGLSMVKPPTDDNDIENED